MEIAEFIAELVLGLKWVVFLGVVLWRFSDPITSLINQIEKFKVSGTGFEFDTVSRDSPPPKTIIGDARERAESGDAEAQYKRGYDYMQGLGVPKDNLEAVTWFRKAADQGHAEARVQLGVMYANGLAACGESHGQGSTGSI